MDPLTALRRARETVRAADATPIAEYPTIIWSDAWIAVADDLWDALATSPAAQSALLKAIDPQVKP